MWLPHPGLVQIIFRLDNDGQGNSGTTRRRTLS
jgi:hypothetical protein